MPCFAANPQELSDFDVPVYVAGRLWCPARGVVRRQSGSAQQPPPRGGPRDPGHEDYRSSDASRRDQMALTDS